MGRSHYAHARQSDPKASISWTTGNGKASAMWASFAVQTLWRLIWSSATSTRQLWAVTHRIAQPGELCAMQQSPSSKICKSKLWNTKEQSGKGFNLAATSASGHVTTALESAATKLDSTPINKLTDDKRSVVPTVQSSQPLSKMMQWKVNK